MIRETLETAYNKLTVQKIIEQLIRILISYTFLVATEDNCSRVHDHGERSKLECVVPTPLS